MKRAALVWLVVVASNAAACAPSLLQEHPFDSEAADKAKVTNEELGDGVTRTTVDATARDAWVFVDLDSKAEVTPEAATWDLQLQRFKIFSNSGAHGEGGVGVAVLPEGTFEELRAAPAENMFQVDVDVDGENDSPFLAGDGWYRYDLLEHRLAARDTVYVVRSTGGAYFKMQFLEYYDSAGSAGVVAFRWGEVAAP